MTTANQTTPSLTHRILDAFPSGSYALGALLRLVDIVETDRIATAAVECRAQPRMLINPQFVDEWASTPERLLMLVMHELHHVLLGHTRLLPRGTMVDNLVFDAVINALLCRMFPQPEHTSFFTEFYSDQKFPECLLRPPEGYSLESEVEVPPALQGPQRTHVAEVYRALYSMKGATYEELYDIFRVSITECQAGGVILIGDHAVGDGSADGQLEIRSRVLFDAVRGIVEHWPQPPDPIRGRSLASLLKESLVRPVSAVNNRQRLRRLIQQVGGEQNYGKSRRSQAESELWVQTPLPALDRRSIVLRSLGSKPLLYNQTLSTPRMQHCGERVHIYLDVSGSIGPLKNTLYGAVLDCRALVYPTVHLFSTEVVDVSLRELREGRCVSTSGTDITCVAAHLAENHINRAVVITDGFVGRATGIAADTLKKARLGVALIEPDGTRDDLEGFVEYWKELPCFAS